MRGEGGETPDPLVTLETQLRVQLICANIINYCRTAMTLGGEGGEREGGRERGLHVFPLGKRQKYTCTHLTQSILHLVSTILCPD